MEATAGNALQDAALRGSIAQLERDLEEARREMRLSQANATRVQADAARYKTLVETVTAEGDAASHAVLVRRLSSFVLCLVSTPARCNPC